MKSKPVMRKRGRPREFDAERALDCAMKIFWQNGYEAASLDELTRAMGISRPSLYAAFGNKAELFRKALDRYESRAGYVCEAMRAPTAREVARRLLFGAADAGTDPRGPRGCLMVQAALTGADDSESIRRELCSRRAAGEAALRARFERARAEGDLPRTCDAADLARYVTTVVRGISVQAAGGATRAQLRAVARTALRAWPTGKSSSKKFSRRGD